MKFIFTVTGFTQLKKKINASIEEIIKRMEGMKLKKINEQFYKPFYNQQFFFFNFIIFK